MSMTDEKLQEVLTRSAAEREGAKRAESVAETWWPERTLPVDPFEIARRIGIEVVAADLDKNLAGFVLKERNEDPEIWIAADDSAQRQRFNVARMIGLYLRASAPEYAYMDYRDTAASKEDDQYADEFAGALLMPNGALSQIGDDESRVAKYFDVTPGTARFHIDRLHAS